MAYLGLQAYLGLAPALGKPNHRSTCSIDLPPTRLTPHMRMRPLTQKFFIPVEKFLLRPEMLQQQEIGQTKNP